MKLSKALLQTIALGVTIGLASSCTTEKHTCDQTCEKPCKTVLAKKDKKDRKLFKFEKGCPACGMG